MCRRARRFSVPGILAQARSSAISMFESVCGSKSEFITTLPVAPSTPQTCVGSRLGASATLAILAILEPSKSSKQVGVAVLASPFSRLEAENAVLRHQPDHATRLGDSVTSSTRMRFSAHTARELGLSRRHERGRWRNNRAKNSHHSMVILVLGGMISAALFTSALSIVKYTADPYDDGQPGMAQIRWAAVPIVGGPCRWLH